TESAEDAATTKAVRDLGLRVRLVDAPFEQPLGYRSAREVWARQLRWAQLRQASFRQYYALEILAGSLAPLPAAADVVAALGAAVGQRSCGRGRVVWRRSRTRARRRMALKPSIARRLYPARHPLASALDRRLPRSRLRLARKRNAAARVARSRLTRDCAAHFL